MTSHADIRGFLLCTQKADGTFRRQCFSNLPLVHPCFVILEALDSDDAQQRLLELADALVHEILDLGAVPVSTEYGVVPPVTNHRVLPDGARAKVVLVLVGDSTGRVPATPQHDVRPEQDYLLPVLPAETDVGAQLTPDQAKWNAAFFAQSPAELAGKVLARAGLTSLDYRIFISYRRAESSALADQLHAELGKHDYQVFLDRISVPPGVDFQDRLREQLAEKAMVVALDSPGFLNSPWTVAELNFARKHHLGVLILRFPEVTSGIPSFDPNERYSLTVHDLDGTGAARVLTNAALEAVVKRIHQEHGRAIVYRRRRFRANLRATLQDHGLTAPDFGHDGLLHLRTTAAGSERRYAVWLSVRPPGLKDFHVLDQGRGEAEKGVLIGPVEALLSQRRVRLDWLSRQSDLAYADFDAVATVAQNIKGGGL